MGNKDMPDDAKIAISILDSNVQLIIRLRRENSQLKQKLSQSIPIDKLEEANKSAMLARVSRQLAEVEKMQLQAELDKYKWIPVSERLPEGDSQVWIWDGYTSRDLRFDLHYKCFRSMAGIHHGITHWMPLPDPPQEQDRTED